VVPDSAVEEAAALAVEGQRRRKRGPLAVGDWLTRSAVPPGSTISASLKISRAMASKWVCTNAARA